MGSFMKDFKEVSLLEVLKNGKDLLLVDTCFLKRIDKHHSLIIKLLTNDTCQLHQQILLALQFVNNMSIIAYLR